MEISVIVPVYNVEKFLPKCLDSLCAQAECVHEIILINDGSTDNSLNICRKYADKDARIRIIDQENKGLSATVRVGVKAATCEYIGFVDSDDYIEPDMFKIMCEKMAETGADVAVCNYDLVYENDGDKEESVLNCNIIARVYDRFDNKFNLPLLPSLEDFTNISGSRCNKIFRRDAILINIGFEDHAIRVGEDIALTIPIMFAAQKIVYIQNNLYHYFQRGSSIVYNYSENNFEDWKKIINLLDSALKKYKYHLDDFLSVQLALLYSVCFSKIRKSKLTFKERRREIQRIGKSELVKEILSLKKLNCRSQYHMFFKLLKWKFYGLLAWLLGRK